MKKEDIMKNLLLIALLATSASQVFAGGICPSWGCNGELPITKSTPISRGLPLDQCVTLANGMQVCEG